MGNPTGAAGSGQRTEGAGGMSEKQPPFVIHVSEMADFPDAVYIGRAVPRRKLKGSKWANPFGVKRHGRDGAIQCFSNYMSRGWDETEALLTDLPELTGKPLACWCRKSDEERTDDNACHGDVLVTLWKERVGHE